MCSVVALGSSGVGCGLRFGVGIDFDLRLRLGRLGPDDLPFGDLLEADRQGLARRRRDLRGIIPPRPSPSWLKYELMLRARRAANVTSVNLESTLSSKLSMGGLIIVSWSSAIVLRAYRMQSVPAAGLEAGSPACAVDDREHLVDGLVEVVVDDEVIREFPADRFFLLGLLQPGEHLVVEITTAAQATLLLVA